MSRAAAETALAPPLPHETRKAVVAAAIGNVLEWYDFGVYIFFAGTIAQNFFPAGHPASALLSSFAVFGVGFLMRPLGGILIGRFGDTHGRRAALTLTIFAMAFGTVMVGVLPPYASIGVAAPVLLVVARLIQGFSAGGEWGGSTAFMVEWAPAAHRGWYGSFQQASIALSLVLGSGTGALFAAVLSPAALAGWGWRIPFLLGILLAIVGGYLRRNVEETPAYRAAEAAPATTAGGFLAGLRAFGFTIYWTVAFYILLSYMPTFTAQHAGVTAAQALLANTIGVVVLMVLIPPFGALSDRVGRKPLLLASCAFFAVLTLPLFAVILGKPGFAVLMLIQILFDAAIALFSGAGPAAISEMFHTIGRSTWMTPAYALAVAIFGGFAPFIAAWLIGVTGSPLAPAYYVIAAAVVSFIVIWRMPETAHRPLL
ncbi:MAG TPA: MFS transporter [Stellaceae bacterium]|nr:MFS transporter [Stellaceae bacterium]